MPVPQAISFARAVVLGIDGIGEGTADGIFRVYSIQRPEARFVPGNDDATGHAGKEKLVAKAMVTVVPVVKGESSR